MIAAARKTWAKWQRQLPATLRGLSARLRLLFSDSDADLVSHQLEETRWTLPVLAAFHFFATLSVFRLAFDYIATSQLLAWTMASFAAEALLILGYFALDHIASSGTRAQSVLRFSPFAVLLLCLVWGWAALVFSRGAEPPVPAYIDLLAILTMSVGLLCTIRMPATALQFILTPVVILVMRARLDEGELNNYGLLVAVMAVAAGVSAMLALNYSFKRRLLAERQLRHDAEVLMMLLTDFGGAAKDWLWETNAKGLVTHHEAKFAEMLGFPGEDCNGVDFISDFVAQTNPLLVSKMLVHEDLHDEPLSTRDAEGKMTHWQLSAKPQFDIHGKFAGYRGIALDVTAIRVETHAVIKAEDHAKRSYETKAQFLMQMAQELRNPVNAIVGFSEMLGSAKGAALPPGVRRDYMNTIFNSGRQVQSLVDDVLEASRLERGLVKLEEQKDDFTTLIETAIKEIVPRAALTQVSVVARLYEDVEVAGDMARLKTLIAALLSRAVTSAPQGSAVQVEMLRTENGDLGLILRDKGAALSADAAKRAVVPFAGLDLGLPMARAVARLHGGDIMLVAGKEGGTEARLLLPAARIAWHPVDGQLKVMNIAA